MMAEANDFLTSALGTSVTTGVMASQTPACGTTGERENATNLSGCKSARHHFVYGDIPSIDKLVIQRMFQELWDN